MRAAIDWRQLRLTLADYRRRVTPDVADFSELTGVQKSTIYRVEDVTKLPKHRPSFKTIEAWLEATNGPALSVFFRQFEDLQSTTDIDNVPHQSPRVGALHDSGSVSSPDAIALTQIIAVVHDLAAALHGVALRAQNYLPATSADDDETPPGETATGSD